MHEHEIALAALPAVTTHLIAGASALQTGAAIVLTGSPCALLAVAGVIGVGLLTLSPWLAWRMLGRQQQSVPPVPQAETGQLDTGRMPLVPMLDSPEDAIVAKDKNGNITGWNRGAERLFGYMAEDMVGKSTRCLLLPDCETEEENILLRINRGETVERIEALRRRKDGQLIQVSAAISPLRNEYAQINGAAKIARDLNEMKQLQHRLQQSQKMEAVGQLTGGIAHDFNNLLAVVIGNLDLLEPLVAGNAAAEQRVRIAQKAALRGIDWTRRLLAFSRQDELRPTSTSLEASVQNMIELAARALGPEISIATNFSAALPPIFVDAAGLENALLNLALNARDAMPRGGSMIVSTYLHELDGNDTSLFDEGLNLATYACVSLSDTGEGMSAATLEKVFEPFFTTKPQGKGTGLGLAMVYGFAKQSGGAVRMNSQPGYGTTVLLYLPLAKNRASNLGLVTKQPRTSAGNVLVVDDEPDLLEISLAYLAELGYTGSKARNAAEALEILARQGPFDLLVTDIAMPGGLNGDDLAQMVRELSPKTRVIYSSGFTADALAERKLKLNDGPLLQKPFRRAEFSAVIRQVMEDRVVEPVEAAHNQPALAEPRGDKRELTPSA